MATKVGIVDSGQIGRCTQLHLGIAAKASAVTSAETWNIALCRIFADFLDIMTLVINIVTGTIFAFKGNYFHKPLYGNPNKSVPQWVDYEVSSRLCFVIMPFMKSFDGIYFEIKKTVECRGMKCLRADETFGQDVLMDTIMTAIRRAAIVIADISLHNPNVLYELGCAHALGKKTILLWAVGGDKVPSDLCHWQYIQYENTLSGGPSLRQKLGAAIDAIAQGVAN